MVEDTVLVGTAGPQIEVSGATRFRLTENVIAENLLTSTSRTHTVGRSDGRSPSAAPHRRTSEALDDGWRRDRDRDTGDRRPTRTWPAITSTERSGAGPWTRVTVDRTSHRLLPGLRTRSEHALLLRRDRGRRLGQREPAIARFEHQHQPGTARRLADPLGAGSLVPRGRGRHHRRRVQGDRGRERPPLRLELGRNRAARRRRRSAHLGCVRRRDARR